MVSSLFLSFGRDDSFVVGTGNGVSWRSCPVEVIISRSLMWTFASIAFRVEFIQPDFRVIVIACSRCGKFDARR